MKEIQVLQCVIWIHGHFDPDVYRMDNDRIKKLFYGELVQGKRSHGRQKKHYKDTLKATPKDCNIDPCKWEETSLDRGVSKLKQASHSLKQIVSQSRRENVKSEKPAMLQPFNVNPSPSRLNLWFTMSSLLSYIQPRIGLISELIHSHHICFFHY